MINTSTYAWDQTKLTCPAGSGPSEFWKATFSALTSIKSSLIIHRDDCCGERPPTYILTFGTNPNVYLNSNFMPERSMTDVGWYIRANSMLGTIFGLYS
jgi:hypothetical protein